MSVGYVFLDLETTGLTEDDEITEAAWLTSSGVSRSFLVSHRRQPSHWVATNTDYGTRILPKMSEWELCSHVFEFLWQDCNAIRSAGATEVYLVGSCISFDDRVIRRTLQKLAVGAVPEPVPYHYHLIDVETMAMVRLGLTEPPQTKDLQKLLGFKEPAGAPHQALYDATVAMLAFWSMVNV